MREKAPHTVREVFIERDDFAEAPPKDWRRFTKDAEVRKQAMNSLQQSRDMRAIAFFEEVLKR